MVDSRQLFQDMFYQIKSTFSHAKTLGWIEKYELEMVLARDAGQIMEDEIAVGLQKILVNLQKTIQIMLTECLGALTNPYHTSPDIRQHKHFHMKVLDETPTYTNTSFRSSKKQTNDYIIDGQPDKVLQQMPREKHLSPQLPTTKETEAANVLMNLSGKAADRSSHARVDVCSNHHQEMPCSAMKPTTLYIQPPISNPSIKREFPPCDEVPQINEKDLLPLATQVLCQFCSQQCEDLVELHEHVLATHNISENEPPFIPTSKKIRITMTEEGTGINASPEAIRTKDPKHRNHDLASQTLSELTTPAKTTTAKRTSEGKKSKRKERHKNVSHNKNTKVPVSYDSSVTQDEGYQERDNWGHSCNDRLEANYEENVHSLPNISVQEHYSTTPEQTNAELTDLPRTTDALAMAIESSKIQVIETKITLSVCIKCSSCFTNAHDYHEHTCQRVLPIINHLPDGSIVLNKPELPDHQDQPQDVFVDVWYFPDFVIQQRKGHMKQPMGGLEIVNSAMGYRLQLVTPFLPAYLSENLISFRCPTCDKEMDTLSKFLDHLTQGPCMFRCPDCSLVYITQDKLQKHRSSLHPTIEDRTCPSCHIVFEKRHQRNKHVKTHCSQLHICDTCGSVLKNEYNLRVHMQSHQERKHVCNECGAAFHRRAILSRHMMQHSGTKPHMCSLCGTRFYTKQHLKMHTDRHNGIKRFPCDACDKAYYSRHERNAHVAKIHIKTQCTEKPTVTNEKT